VLIAIIQEMSDYIFI